MTADKDAVSFSNKMDVISYKDGSVRLIIKAEAEIPVHRIEEVAQSFIKLTNIPFPDSHKICFLLAGIFGHDTERINQFLSQLSVSILAGKSNLEQ